MLPPSQKKASRYHGKKIRIVTLNLPDDLIQIILSFLPIKQAVGCGVLSTRFKNSWLFSRNLVFDMDFSRHRSRGDFMRVVNRVLNLHSGSKIERFHLFFDPTDVEPVLEDWIQRVTLKGIEELDLDFSQAKQPLNLPSHLVEVESIRSLKVTYCQLVPPPKFESLSSLKTLVLQRVDATAESVARVVSNCSLLESLELVKCDRIIFLNVFAKTLKWFKRLEVRECRNVLYFNIDAPTLCIFHYRGVDRTIKFYNQMPNLNDVTLDFMPARGISMHCDMRNLMMGLAHVHDLRVNSGFLEELSPKYMDGTLRGPNLYLRNLKEFHLLREGFSFINPYDIASFIDKSPCLETVFLDLGEFPFEHGYYWEMHAKPELEQCSPQFLCLKMVKVKGFKFQNLEIQLVKFFLKNTRCLETLTLVPSKKSRSNFFQDAHKCDHLLHSWKASPCAKIEYAS